jgi:hypothetical protein
MIALYEPSITAIFMGLLVVRVVYAMSLSFAVWQVAEHKRVSIWQLKRSLAFSGWL